MARFSFIGRRLLQLIPVLFGITLITFFLLRLIPGDPALQILGQHYTPAGAKVVRHSLGLDEPLWRQYLLFLQHLFQGNLGESITYKQSTRTAAGGMPPEITGNTCRTCRFRRTSIRSKFHSRCTRC